MKWLLTGLIIIGFSSCREKTTPADENTSVGNASPTVDCARCKTGAFKSYSDYNEVSYVIFRHDSTQKEVSDQDKSESLHDLKWLSPCTYQIKWRNNKELRDEIGAITVNIYDVNGDTCFYKARAENPDFPVMTGYQVKAD